MKVSSAKRQGWILGAGVLMAVWLPIAAFSEPTNGPLFGLGLTNVPIGNATLEIIDNGVLFVGNTDGGGGVSVHLGEADSGIFLYPLTGYLYGGDAMEAKAYGSVSGAADQFISSVEGMHNGDGRSATITVDFTSLGATRLSVFAGTTSLGQITNSTVEVMVAGNGYGCRANPWWRQPDGSYGALIELAQDGSWYRLGEGVPDDVGGGNWLFIRPDDPTNSVEFVSRVDVTSTGLSSFCLTDARLGVFHQRHKALGQATLQALGDQLKVGNFVSNVEDGVFVELASVNTFSVGLLPLELPETNSIVLITGIGTSSGSPGVALGNLRIDNTNGSLQIGMDMSLGPTPEIQVRSNGVPVGSVAVASNAAFATLSGHPRPTNCTLLAKTMETQPGFVVRFDQMTIFTGVGGQSLEGDEVRLLVPEPFYFDSFESFVMLAGGLPSFTITSESQTFEVPPELNITRSTNGIILSWPNPNLLYFLEVSFELGDGFGGIQVEQAFADNHSYVTLGSQDDHRFFRLRRIGSSD